MDSESLPDDNPETVSTPLEPVQRKGLSLFWRTFILLTILLLGCIGAWLQTFRSLELEPRALHSAQQLASLVNLSRVGLINADPIARISLVKTLVDEENLRIAMREPTDVHLLYDQDPLSRRISAILRERLGPDTLVAREVNGFAGLWIGFNIEKDTFWLLVDPERIGLIGHTTWLVWLVTAVLISLAGAALMARLINRPLKMLSFAASRVREGNFAASRLDEKVTTSEIREVNIGFNRMAQQLSKAEEERELMLAGISHDLRTPLARLRLETEMSVTDEQARTNMAADIEQVNAIIDKFLDYARSNHQHLEKVSLNQVVAAALQALDKKSPIRVRTHIPPDTNVLGDRVELQRIFVNLLENACRYGRSSNGIAEVDIAAKEREQWVLVKVRDHGPGADEQMLRQLTRPFFRGDQARTSASGAGLGLAIVERTITRMGGRFSLANSSSGGLSAHFKLQKA